MTESQVKIAHYMRVAREGTVPQQKKAFMLLTVSTPRQRSKNNENATLMKLSRQREALRGKAAELDAYISGEIILQKSPAGCTESPAFRYLLRTIETENIDFVLIYPVCLYRSIEQNAITRETIEKAGAELVSFGAGQVTRQMRVADWFIRAHQPENAA